MSWKLQLSSLDVGWSWKSELGLSSSRREESEEAGRPSARLEELDGKRMRKGEIWPYIGPVTSQVIGPRVTNSG